MLELTVLWVVQLVTAKGLTIRVINNVSKRMEVKPRFHEAFQKEGCPDAYPYRQKVHLHPPPPPPPSYLFGSMPIH